MILLTPTGGRQEAFSILERCVASQTYQNFKWIVVDDCEPRTHTTMGQMVINPLPSWKPGDATTQHRNMIALLDAALEFGNEETFVILEDDDHVAPSYLAACEHHLRNHELIGEKPARYYNVRTRHWRIFQNNAHASLCQTAFRRSMIQPLREVVASNQWIDMTFWPKYLSRGLLWEGYNVVGIKGMPGRGGVSNAHRETAKWGHYDADLSKLREWIGKDAEVYSQYVESNIEQPVVTNWCASCGMAVVATAGDICERCATAGAEQLQIPTFTWGKPGREITMFRCPEWPRCRFDASTQQSIVKHMRGCPAKEERMKLGEEMQL